MPFLGALRVRAACSGFGPAAGLARARKGPRLTVRMKKCTKGRRTRDGGFFSGKVALPALAVQSRVSRVFRMMRDAPVPAVAQPLSLRKVADLCGSEAQHSAETC